MKKQLILKGFHRPLQLLPAFLKRPCLSSDSIVMEKRVIFTDSCRYSLDGGDQDDWNKLFGFCFGIFGIHKNSARAVWRYVPEFDSIEIALYSYIDGVRDYHFCTSIPLNHVCNLTLIYDKRDKRLALFTDSSIHRSVRKEVSFPDKPVFGCGLYFGGNRRAPHNITIYEYSINTMEETNTNKREVCKPYSIKLYQEEINRFKRLGSEMDGVTTDRGTLNALMDFFENPKKVVVDNPELIRKNEELGKRNEELLQNVESLNQELTILKQQLESNLNNSNESAMAAQRLQLELEKAQEQIKALEEAAEHQATETTHRPENSRQCP